MFGTASLTLFLVLSLFIFSSFNSHKTYAASGGEVYPAPTTEYRTPTSNSWPDGIIGGPEGNLWFTEYNSSKIGRITPGGKVTEFALPTGSAPTGIATGPDGNLWFTERYGDAIGRITPAGAITEFPYTYSAVDPGSLTVGPDGNLWFTDYGQNGIGRITPAGVITEFPAPSTSINPTAITTGADSKLWFTAISQIVNITTAGITMAFSLNSGYSFPQGITAGPDGNLWFTEQNSFGNAIGRITPNGVITDFPLPTVTYPDGTTWSVVATEITAGPDGNLWFTSPQSLVGRITPGGNITLFVPLNSSSFGGGIAPTGITSGPDGNIWFADYGHNQIGYLALGGTTTTPTPTPTSSISSAACPSLAECLLASDAAYGLDRGGSSFTPPTGMTELTRSGNITDGFEAVALLDNTGNIIIANEGSLQLKGVPNGYTWNSGKADLAIYNNQQHIPALTDAINFVGQALQEYYGKPGYGEIYVTGHSLGGIEAEAEAKAWSNIAGGITFGATGLPGNTTAGGPATLINYVEYGDPVGNYASDPVNALSEQTLGVMYHYGQVMMIGSTQDVYQLQKAVIRRDAQLELPPSTPNPGTLDKYAADYLEISAFANAALNLRDHSLRQYATDLISATIPPLSSVSLESLLLMYDLQLGNTGFNNLKATTVQANGTLTSPPISLSENVNTDQITLDNLSPEKISVGTLNSGVATFYLDPFTRNVVGEKFVASDGAVYFIALASAENPTTIAVTLKTGGSYRIRYDTLNQQAWNNAIQFYTGKNETGTITEIIYNWRVGGSQVQLFTGLPHGYTEELKNYSGPNGTGTLLSIQYK